MAISVKVMPVEAYHSIGKVERYYGPLRRAYIIIRSKDPFIRPKLTLQITIKVINDTIRPNSLIPILLVFSAYPRMT